MPRDPNSPGEGQAPERRSITGERPTVTQPLPKVRQGAAPAYRTPSTSAPPPPPHSDPTPPVAPPRQSTPPAAPPRPMTHTGPRPPDREASREWEMGTVASSQQQQQQRRAPAQPARAIAPRFFPPQPRNIPETGLSATMVEELVLKALFFAGEMRGSELSQRLKLPTIIIDEVIEGLRKQKYIDLKGGAGLGVGKSAT